jgi:hypothetical protein
MKKGLTFLIVILGLTINADAQIFINTGKKSIEQLKQDDAATKEKAKSEQTAPAKTSQPATTPAPVKAQPQAAKPVPTPAPVKAATLKPAAPAATAVAKSAAQEDTPPNAEPGKCYSKSVMPDKFKIVEEMVIDKPAEMKTIAIPAKYDLVSDTVLVKPASVKYVGGTITYETTTEEVLVTPETSRWVRMKYDTTCVSKVPEECLVYVLKYYPAVYKKVTKKVQKPSSETKEVAVPAEYKITKKKVLVSAAREVKEELPPTYKKIMRKEILSKGGDVVWTEIICQKDLTKDKIMSVQQALKEAGYDAGTPDGAMGAQTKLALSKYQKDKGFPVGNLDIETLNALGIK